MNEIGEIFSGGGRSKAPCCKFNIGVDCERNPGSKCSKCGWNPEVAERRKQLNRKYPSRIKVHN